MSLDKKINIAYISRTSNLTGAEKITLDIARSLNKNHFKPVIFLPDNQGAFYDALILSGIEARITDMPFLRVTCNPFLLIKFFLKIISLNKRFIQIFKKESIDIVSCNTIHEALFVFKAVRYLKLKLIVCFKNILDKKWKKKIRARFCSAFADKILAVSEKAEKDYTHFINNEIKKSKSLVVNDCIDYEDYKKDFTESALDYPGKDKSDFIIINVGSIQELKGQLLLLRAANNPSLKEFNIKIFLIGDIYHKNDLPYKEKILQYIKDNELTDRVFLAGYQKDVRNYFYNADLFIHCPIIDDAFPRAILEAFCFKKICIGTRTGGIPEIIEDGFNGFLCEINEKHLAEKIAYVYKNKNDLKQIQENALFSVQNKFSLKRQVEETEKIYIEVLKKR